MTEATQRMTQNPLKIHPGRAPGTTKIDPSTLPEHLRTKKNHLLAHSWPKSHESRPKVGPKWPVRDPSGTPKSTKKRPGAKKALPRWRRKRFSAISWTVVVRNHFPEQFWDGPNLENHSFPTVKLQFSQNHRFRVLVVFGPKMGPKIDGF